MHRRLLRSSVATVALAGTLALAGCSSADGGSVAPQQQRNEAIEELADARQAVLAPVATRLELLARADQRAQLAGESGDAVQQQIAAYSALAAAVEAAPSAETVRTLVDQAGLDVGEGNGDPTDAAVVVADVELD